MRLPPGSSEFLRTRSLLEITVRIMRFQETDLSKLNDDQIFNRISAIMTGWLVRLIRSKTSILWRARANLGTELFLNTSELWSPPPKLITSRGRFNGVGESFFYCSDDPETSLMEIRPSPDQLITLLGLRKKNETDELVSLPAGLELYESASPSISFGAGINSMHFSDLLRRTNNYKKFKKIDNWLSQKLTAKSSEENYRITNILARKFFFPYKESVGLMYPSIVSKFRAVNFCIEPEATEFLFEAFDIRVVRIVSFDEASRTVITENIARSEKISDSGDISWSYENTFINESLKTLRVKIVSTPLDKEIYGETGGPYIKRRNF